MNQWISLLQGTVLKRDKLTWDEWHLRVNYVTQKFATFEEFSKAFQDENTTSFLIVRHPFQRLISAFQDKFANYNVRNQSGTDLKSYLIFSYAGLVLQLVRKEGH